MNRNHGLGAGGKCRADAIRRHQQRRGIDVHEYRLCADKLDNIRGCNECLRRDNDFVSGPDFESKQCGDSAVSPAIHKRSMLCAKIFAELGLNISSSAGGRQKGS